MAAPAVRPACCGQVQQGDALCAHGEHNRVQARLHHVRRRQLLPHLVHRVVQHVRAAQCRRRGCFALFPVGDINPYAARSDPLAALVQQRPRRHGHARHPSRRVAQPDPAILRQRGKAEWLQRSARRIRPDEQCVGCIAEQGGGRPTQHMVRRHEGYVPFQVRLEHQARRDHAEPLPALPAIKQGRSQRTRPRRRRFGIGGHWHHFHAPSLRWLC